MGTDTLPYLYEPPPNEETIMATVLEAGHETIVFPRLELALQQALAEDPARGPAVTRALHELAEVLIPLLKQARKR